LDKDAAYSAQLRALAGANERIKFLGPFQRSELARVLADIDVLVVPSLWDEPYGLVVQEAFAAGTPVIGSRVGALPESITHESNGLLFEVGNVEDLSLQMTRVVSEPGLLAKLRAGIRPVKTIEQEVSDLLEIYQQLAGRTVTGELSNVE